ncbi:MAG TPA: SCO family protein [Thermoleophilaceae bacterium]
MNPRVLIALVLVAVFALGAAVLAAQGGSDSAGETASSKFEGALMPKGVKAPAFDLKDEYGKPISMSSFRGKPVVVSFLYTHCQNTCPAQAQTIRGALDDLGHDVPAIAISVDPPNDTDDSAQAFLSKQHALGRLHFVLGTRAQLSPLWKRFGIQPQTKNQEHLARVTLVDKRGYQRIGYPGAQATPERLAHDLKLLERE